VTSTQYVGLGFLVFVGCAGLHWLLWNRALGSALESADAGVRAAGLKRWLKAVAVLEVLGLVGAGAWLIALRAAGAGGVAWIAPAVGLVAGNAFPLQLAVLGITRSAKARR